VYGQIFSLISMYELHLDSERLGVWPDFQYDFNVWVGLTFREARYMARFSV
jgi:hypothetical protein